MAALGTAGLRAARRLLGLAGLVTIASGTLCASGSALELQDATALLQISSAQSGSSGQLHSKAQGADEEEEEAVRLHRSLSFADGEECPTTYIYDIPELWDLEVPLKDITPEVAREALDRLWLGRDSSCNNTGMHYLAQYSMAEIVLHRLLSSQRCKVTQDPEEADLLLVPYLPRTKTPSDLASIDSCLDPTPLLKHMNARTAHKHLLLLSKGHTFMDHCGDWWRRPTGLLSRAIRVSYSAVVREKDESWPTSYGPFDSRDLTIGRLAQMSRDFESDDVPYPHSYSVPYPATGVLGDEPFHEPWKDYTSKRPLLAYFIGGMHGKYGIEIRQKLVADCEKAGSPTCLYKDPSTVTCQSIALKKQAYFCLEPGGDSPYRKSPYDDLSMGCIPVLFSPYMQLVSPWHWGHFNNASNVYINRFDYLEGRLDLFKVLGDIAASPRLEELRRSIAANGHATQYSKRDYPGDGVKRLLIGAHHAAQRREARAPEGSGASAAPEGTALSSAAWWRGLS